MLQVYDRVISSGSMSTLLMLTLLMMGLLAASGAFDWIRSRLLIAANVQLEEALRDKVATSAFRYTLITGNPSEANQGMSDLVELKAIYRWQRYFWVFGCTTGSDLHRRHVFVSPVFWICGCRGCNHNGSISLTDTKSLRQEIVGRQ